MSLLVLTPRSGDFWRAAGAVALAVSRCERVVVGCTSLGEGDESASQCLHSFTSTLPDRCVQAKRKSGPNLGLAEKSYAEAYQHMYPQSTGEFA